MRKKQLISGLIIFGIGIAVLALLAGGVFFKFKSHGQRKPQAPYVDVAAVTVRTYRPSINVLGLVRAIHGVTLKTAVAGQVTAVHFKSNEKVKQGRLLLEVDPAQLQAQLKFYQAQHDKDKLTIDRDKTLLTRNAISQATYDNDEASYRQSEAQVAEYKALLARAMVTAPFAGEMGVRQVQLGDYLSVGDSIAALVQLNPLWVDCEVPSKYLAAVRPGLPADIRSQAFAGETFHGKVTAVAPQVNENSDSFTVRLTADNSEEKLRPGQAVNVTLNTGKAERRIMVPVIAVIYNEQGTFVYKAEGDKAVLTPVKVGEQAGQDLLVQSGLRAGDTIVVNGTNKLRGQEATIHPVRGDTDATAADTSDNAAGGDK